MVVVTLINRLRSIQSLLLLMTSVVMGNKMGVCNSLSLGLCTEEAALAVVTASQTLLTRQSVKPWWDMHPRCKEFRQLDLSDGDLSVICNEIGCYWELLKCVKSLCQLKVCSPLFHITLYIMWHDKMIMHLKLRLYLQPQHWKNRRIKKNRGWQWSWFLMHAVKVKP